MTIQTRLFWAFLAVGVLIVTAAATLSYSIAHAALRDRIEQDHLRVAEFERRRAEAWVQQYLTYTRETLTRDTFNARLAIAREDPDDPDGWRDVSAWLAERTSGALAAVHILGPDSRVLASSEPAFVGREPPLPTPSPHPRAAGGEPTVLFGRRADGSPGRAVVVHRLGDGLLALIEGRLDRLIDDLETHGRFGRTGETVIGGFDADGRAFSLNELRFVEPGATGELPGMPQATPMRRVIEDGEVGLLGDRVVDYRRQPVIAAGHPIADSNWGVIVKIDRAEALSPLRRLMVAMIGVLALGVTVSAMVARWVSRGVTAPIATLARAARHGAAVPPDITGRHDEVGALAQSLAARSAEVDLARDKLNHTLTTLEQRVTERTAALRQLAVDLTRAEERERRRLAHLLHDHLQQVLVATKMKIDLFTRSGDTTRIASLRSELLTLIDESIATSRSLSVELSPPIVYTGSFLNALRWLGSRFTQQHGLPVDVTGDDRAAPDADGRAFLFQATRELLLNTVKHAGATRARITLDRVDGRVRVTIGDDGRGFDPTAPTGGDGQFGLFSIRERLVALGGSMTVDSAPGRGVTTTLSLPTPGA
jgi:signal transduction histidine kinase